MASIYDYSGVIHIHSTYSDGLMRVPEIIKAANQAGCDYLVLTDHDTTKGCGYEGWHGSTLVMVGEEITVGEEKGHYLGLCLKSEIPPHLSPQKTVSLVKKRGGLGYIAHPFSRPGRHILKLTPLPWKDWQVKGFNGMEIWNYSQDWEENFQGLDTLLPGLFNPDSFIEGPPPQTLQKWDELLQRVRVTGIGGVDAHGYFYSYRRMFKTLHTHLLTRKSLSYRSSSYKMDMQNLCEALRKGNSYFSYDYLADAGGFMFSGDNGRARVIMGEGLELEKGVLLKVSTTRTGLIRVVRGGKLVSSVEGSNILTAAVKEPGAYRVEVFLKGRKGLKAVYRPWIFSNPIYVSHG